MAKKGYTPEQIINKLREAEILLNQGATIAVVSKKIGVSDYTYYRWRKEYGGMRVDQARKIKNQDVLDILFDLFIFRGIPEHIRSDNGPEFTAKAVRKWLNRLGVKTLFIGPDSPWEKGYIESFNGKMRDELLNGEIFMTLEEAKVLIEQWRKEYNQIRPHSSLGYQPPAPEAIFVKVMR
jgi:transposase InsO family protein